MPSKEEDCRFIKHLITQPPAAPKKDGRFQHLYSNASYTIASAMLEKVTGERYEELVKRTLEDDLGMPVHIGWPNSISPAQPWGHLITGKKVEVFPPDHEYKVPYLITPAKEFEYEAAGLRTLYSTPPERAEGY
ncbi:MAG: serine hydrolase domain-containing protein [Chloroflexota bacterium]